MGGLRRKEMCDNKKKYPDHGNKELGKRSK